MEPTLVSGPASEPLSTALKTSNQTWSSRGGKQRVTATYSSCCSMKTRAGPLPDRWTWLVRLSCVRRLPLAFHSLFLLVSLGSAKKLFMSTSAPKTELAVDDSVWLEVDSCGVD